MAGLIENCHLENGNCSLINFFLLFISEMFSLSLVECVSQMSGVGFLVVLLYRYRVCAQFPSPMCILAPQHGSFEILLFSLICFLNFLFHFEFSFFSVCKSFFLLFQAFCRLSQAFCRLSQAFCRFGIPFLIYF